MVNHGNGFRALFKDMANPKPVIINHDDLILIMREIRLMLIFCFMITLYVVFAYKVDLLSIQNELTIMSDRLKMEIHIQKNGTNYIYRNTAPIAAER